MPSRTGRRPCGGNRFNAFLSNEALQGQAIYFKKISTRRENPVSIATHPEIAPNTSHARKLYKQVMFQVLRAYHVTQNNLYCAQVHDEANAANAGQFFRNFGWMGGLAKEGHCELKYIAGRKIKLPNFAPSTVKMYHV